MIWNSFTSILTPATFCQSYSSPTPNRPCPIFSPHQCFFNQSLSGIFRPYPTPCHPV